MRKIHSSFLVHIPHPQLLPVLALLDKANVEAEGEDGVEVEQLKLKNAKWVYELGKGTNAKGPVVEHHEL